MKLLVTLLLLGLVASGQALKCYTCKSVKGITGVDFGKGASQFTTAPPCSEFDESSPDDKKFLKDCPALFNKACVKFTDPKDSKNQIRGCMIPAKDECKNNACYCTTDMCNGSERGWPSAALLLAALAAALVGGR